MQISDPRCKAYAQLLIRAGVNLQPGQRLLIECCLERADFARLCAAEAYEAGCSEVLFRWRDDEFTRMKYLRAAEAVFDRADPWTSAMLNELSEEGAGLLAIVGEDPRNLRGVAPDRIRRARTATGNAVRPFRERESRNEFPWCVCAAPTAAWAEAVFPVLAPEAAVDRLWEEIFRACRVAETPGADAVAGWHAHTAALKTRVETLNSLRLRTLHYRNGLGTELRVELPEDHFWAGGDERCVRSGLPFSANLPSEEIFTLPRRDGVNGVVYGSKPLVYDGTVIEGLRLELRDGRIVSAAASSGEAVLRGALTVDEGAAYLGEVALVPAASPISASGILFYETLFDENASCHFAFGDAYPCIRGAERMDPEELRRRGANHSITHVDFMVGTPDLSIVGVTEEGVMVPVFVNGNFAF